MKATLTLAAALLGLANAANIQLEELEGVISNALSSAALSEGEESQAAANCEQVCAAQNNYGACRKKYYGINQSGDGCCCQWKTATNTIEDSPDKSCLSLDCPRDYDNGNPGAEGSSSRVSAVLSNILDAPIYTGTKSCSKRPCMGTGTKNAAGQRKSNDYETCYRIWWRGTGQQCSNNCNALFSSLISTQGWGSKVYYSCMMGCEYGEREVEWREAIGKESGIWTAQEEKDQQIQRFENEDSPGTRLLAGSQKYRDELPDYDCAQQCRMTVWNRAKNSRCNWNKGLDLNVPELFDFGAVRSCEFGCRLAMDPSAGALPFNYDQSGVPK